MAASQTGGGDSGLTFPVYLVGGSNGQLGIDVWEYITDVMVQNGIAMADLSNTPIYINNTLITTWYTPAPLDYIKTADVYSDMHQKEYFLNKYGFITIYTHDGN